MKYGKTNGAPHSFAGFALPAVVPRLPLSKVGHTQFSLADSLTTTLTLKYCLPVCIMHAITLGKQSSAVIATNQHPGCTERGGGKGHTCLRLYRKTVLEKQDLNRPLCKKFHKEGWPGEGGVYPLRVGLWLHDPWLQVSDR